MKKTIAISLTVIAVLAVSNYLTHKQAFSAGDRNGYNRAIGEYSAQVAALAQEALDEQNQLQGALNNVASAYHQSMTQEQVKHAKSDLQDKPRVQDCTADPAGAADAVLSADAVRLLESRRRSEALPEAGAGPGAAGEEIPTAAP